MVKSLGATKVTLQNCICLCDLLWGPFYNFLNAKVEGYVNKESPKHSDQKLSNLKFNGKGSPTRLAYNEKKKVNK